MESKILYVNFLVVVALSLLNISCQDPLSSRYNNSSDPTSVNYIPTVPSQLTVSMKSDDNFLVEWKDESSAEDGFKLFIKSGTETDFTLLATLGKDSTSYTDTTIKLPDTKYRYRIYSFKGTRLSRTFMETSTQFSFNAPVLTSVSGLDSTHLTISWESDPPFPTETVVERWEPRPVKVIAVLPKGTSTFTDTTVDKHNIFSYNLTSRTKNKNSRPNFFRSAYRVTRIIGTRWIEIPVSPYGEPVGLLSDDESLFLSVNGLEALVIDINTGTLVKKIIFEKPVGNVHGVALSKNKNVFAVASLDNKEIKVYSVTDGKVLRTFKSNFFGSDVALTNDGSQAVIAFRSDEVQCWNIADSTLIWRKSFSSGNQTNPLVTCALWMHPDGKRVLMGSGGTCRVFRISDGLMVNISNGGYFLKTPLIYKGDALAIIPNGNCQNITQNRTEFNIGLNWNSVSISSDKLFVIAARSLTQTKIINLVSSASTLYPEINLWGEHRYSRFFDKDRQFLLYNDEGRIAIWNLVYGWETFN